MALKSRSSSFIDCHSLAFWAVALLVSLSHQQQQQQHTILLVKAQSEIDPIEKERDEFTISETNTTTITSSTDDDTINDASTFDDLPSSFPSALPTALNCEARHYDCYGCLEVGCYWCPTDGLCFATPEYIERNTNYAMLWPDRFHNCKAPESFTQTTCTTPYNHFTDPLYSAQNWIFAAIKVVPVWERGYYGTGVRVRINDDGIETTHPEFFNRLDTDASCPNGTTAASLDTDHGMTVASLVGAAGNNSSTYPELFYLYSF